MTVTPQMRVDTADWPELAPAIGATIQKTTDIMQMFALQSIRRYRKTVAAERQTTDDVISRMPVDVPQSIASVRFEVGRALLDLLDAVGVNGVDLTLGDDDVASLKGYWSTYGRQVSGEEAPRAQAVPPAPQAEVVDMHGIGQSPVPPRQPEPVRTVDLAGSGTPVPVQPDATRHDNPTTGDSEVAS